MSNNSEAHERMRFSQLDLNQLRTRLYRIKDRVKLQRFIEQCIEWSYSQEYKQLELEAHARFKELFPSTHTVPTKKCVVCGKQFPDAGSMCRPCDNLIHKQDFMSKLSQNIKKAQTSPKPVVDQKAQTSPKPVIDQPYPWEHPVIDPIDVTGKPRPRASRPRTDAPAPVITTRKIRIE